MFQSTRALALGRCGRNRAPSRRCPDHTSSAVRPTGRGDPRPSAQLPLPHPIGQPRTPLKSGASPIDPMHRGFTDCIRPMLWRAVSGRASGPPSMTEDRCSLLEERRIGHSSVSPRRQGAKTRPLARETGVRYGGTRHLQERESALHLARRLSSDQAQTPVENHSGCRASRASPARLERDCASLRCVDSVHEHGLRLGEPCSPSGLFARPTTVTPP